MPEGFAFATKVNLDIGWNQWINSIGSYRKIEKKDGGFVAQPIQLH